jgi:hypothetical protein
MLEGAIDERTFTATWFIGDRMRAHGSVYGFDEIPVIGLSLQQAAEEERLSDVRGLLQRMKEHMETLRVGQTSSLSGFAATYQPSEDAPTRRTFNADLLPTLR